MKYMLYSDYARIIFSYSLLRSSTFKLLKFYLADYQSLCVSEMQLQRKLLHHREHDVPACAAALDWKWWLGFQLSLNPKP